MYKNTVSIIFFYILLFASYSYGSQIKIIYKIDDEIITNLDILEEKNYLIFLRPKLKSLPNEELLKISENSLIREIIKKKEVKKKFKDFNNKEYLDDIKKKLFYFKNVDSEEDFVKLLNKNNINYNKILEKVKYEGLWNELIIRKFNSLIKLDKKKLKDELNNKISNNKKYEYNLSEILFEVENNENYKDKYNKILKYINKNDFKSASAKFSVSNSANRGGEIGWIKETVLSKKLLNIIYDLKKGQISKPIKYPNGYLILKINDLKEMKQIIDINKELDEKIRFEQNRQLNQFSLLYYKKLKQNTKINEY
mgnify:FL=1